MLGSHKKMFEQHDENDCAVACVAMILRCYNINFSYQHIREVIGTDYMGTNLYALLEGVKQLGIKGTAYQTDCLELKNMCDSPMLEKPFIAHTVENHFIVITSLKKNSITIADPKGAAKRMSYKEFEKMFSGNIIIFEKSSCSESQKSPNHTLQLLRLIRPNKKTLTSITIASLLILLIGIANSLIFQLIIDSSTENHIHTLEAGHSNIVTELIEHINHIHHPNEVFGIILILCIFQALAFVWRGLCVYRFSKNIHSNLLMITHEKLIGGRTDVIKTRLTGEYLSRLNDIDIIKSSIASASYIIVVDIFVIGTGLVLLSIINKTLCAVVILIYIIYSLLVLLFAPVLSKSNYKLLETTATAEAYYKEVIECFELVKKNNAQGVIRESTKDKFDAKLEAKYKSDKIKLFQQTLLASVESVGLVVVLWIGYALVNDKQLSAGELMSFYMLAAFFIAPMKDLLELQPLIQTGKASIERVFDIINMTQECEGNSKFAVGDISFNRVSFGYKAGFDIFTELTLMIKKGEKVAIQAPSGTGKTTFAKLMLGLYEPQQGDIRINDINLSEISKNDLRKNIGYVSQTENFFSGTVYENITFGMDNHNENMVNDVLQTLKLDGCIHESLPFGLNTYIEEQGRNLSSGQLQKIAIARAIIRNPKILILDEAVSNIGRNEATNIINSIIHMREIDTLIVITHDDYLANLCERKIYLM